MALSTFTYLWNHHHYLVSELFSSCKNEILYQLHNNSHSLLPQALATIILPSIPMNLTTLGVSYKQNHTVSVLVSLAYFT